MCQNDKPCDTAKILSKKYLFLIDLRVAAGLQMLHMCRVTNLVCGRDGAIKTVMPSEAD